MIIIELDYYSLSVFCKLEMAEWSPGSKSPLMENKVGRLEGSTLEGNEATLQKKERIVGMFYVEIIVTIVCSLLLHGVSEQNVSDTTTIQGSEVHNYCRRRRYTALCYSTAIRPRRAINFVMFCPIKDGDSVLFRKEIVIPETTLQIGYV